MSKSVKTQVVSMRLQDGQVERLRRLSRRLGRTPSETGALLVEEALRRAEFGHIEFRDSAVGRQAYVQGSRLAVWQVVQIARSYGQSHGQSYGQEAGQPDAGTLETRTLDAGKAADHLGWPAVKVQAALEYAQAFPEEIEAALADNAAFDAETLRRMLPQAQAFSATDEPAAEPNIPETGVPGLAGVRG